MYGGIRRYKINVREKQKEGKIKLYVILVIFIALVYLKYSVSKWSEIRIILYTTHLNSATIKKRKTLKELVEKKTSLKDAIYKILTFKMNLKII